MPDTTILFRTTTLCLAYVFGAILQPKLRRYYGYKGMAKTCFALIDLVARRHSIESTLEKALGALKSTGESVWFEGRSC